ncbi:MAG TPA: uracil-DNA glycosylase [Planctomycetes bacterium]|nr:uracil-DNA glycosylase [Planctomycetaceae bacterium]HIM28558.1 uracil-DNA glycosylase [Planctomycetota bacterium]
MPSRFVALDQQVIACERCTRLRDHCETIAREKRRAYREWDYWGRPVPNFGDSNATLLIIGLAPAAHGANRTGRMFTGDRSGDWLFRAMHRVGFANQAEANSREDGLELTGALITAVCHCAPPGNKPNAEEILHCRTWLEQTIDIVAPKIFLALGKLAWDQSIHYFRAQGQWDGKIPPFGHGAEHRLADGRVLLGSYHPSQQNTFTGRLTEEMLDSVFQRAAELQKQFD